MRNVHTQNTATPKYPSMTPYEVNLWHLIKKSTDAGHDVEVKKAPDGSLKVLTVKKVIISAG